MKRALALPMLLAGCLAAQTPEQQEHRSIIVTSSGELGRFVKEIRPDDTVILTGYSPVPPAPPITTVVPGAYERALAVLRADGLATVAAVVPDADADCPDYGFDLVRIDPPTPWFDAVSAECPQPALTALMRDLLAAVDAGQ